MKPYLLMIVLLIAVCAALILWPELVKLAQVITLPAKVLAGL